MDNKSTIAGPDYAASKTLAFSSVSAASAAFTSHHFALRLVATEPCFVNVSKAGKPALAGAGSMFLPANLPEYVVAVEGSIVTAIQAGTSGTLYITPCQ